MGRGDRSTDGGVILVHSVDCASCFNNSKQIIIPHSNAVRTRNEGFTITSCDFSISSAYDRHAEAKAPLDLKLAVEQKAQLKTIKEDAHEAIQRLLTPEQLSQMETARGEQSFSSESSCYAESTRSKGKIILRMYFNFSR